MRLGFGAIDLAARLKGPSALVDELIGRMQHRDKAGQIRVADQIFGGSNSVHSEVCVGFSTFQFTATTAIARDVRQLDGRSLSWVKPGCLWLLRAEFQKTQR